MYDLNLSFRQLLCFQKLAESEHLGRTAEELLVSSAALSGLIKRLEQEIGQPLFTRTGRNIRLNEAGRILYGHVDNMLNELSLARREIHTRADEEKSDLVVGLATPGIWRKRVRTWAEKNPSVRLTLSVLRMSQLANSYETANYDLIIAATENLPQSKWNSVRLCSNNNPYLVTYRNHPFAGKHCIDLAEARDEPFILLLKEYSFRNYCEQLFNLAGFRPKIAMECDYQFTNQMLKAEYGVVLSSEMAMGTDEFEDPVYIKVKNPSYPRTFAAFWDKRRRLSRAAEEFIQYLADGVEERFR